MLLCGNTEPRRHRCRKAGRVIRDRVGPATTARSAAAQPSVVSLRRERDMARDENSPSTCDAAANDGASARRTVEPEPSQPEGRAVDVTLLYAARGVRGFGDGFAIIILPAYLTAIGFDAVWVGIVATASLLGSAVLTLAVGFLGARYPLRSLLLAGALLMIATGIAFPQSANIAVIVLVAFIGTVNPSTGDIGMLVPLEHASLARTISNRHRTRAFARYSLTGALATAAGSLAAATPDALAAVGIDAVTA